MWNIVNHRFTVSYSFLNCRKSANGMAKYILTQQKQFLEHEVSYVYIYCIKKTICHDTKLLFCKYGVIIDGQRQGIFSIEEILKNIFEAVKVGKKLCAVHLHHLIYSDFHDLQALLACTAPTPVYLYLHDHYTVCTGYHLLKNRKTYCGNDGVSKQKCEECEFYKGAQIVLPQVRELLAAVKDRLIVISPSNSTAEIWLKSYPEYMNNIKTVPHKIFRTESRKKENCHSSIRFAFLGRPVEHKGWQQWEKLVERFGEDNHFEFYVLGDGKIYNEHMKFIYVSVTKDNMNAMVDALLENEIDVCFLWAIWPETYSYTCVESIEAGAYIFTNRDSGNIADLAMLLNQGKIFADMDEVYKYLKSDVLRDVLSWKSRYIDQLEIKSAVDNDTIVEECCTSIKCSDKNMSHYRRFDLMPKWLLTLLTREEMKK